MALRQPRLRRFSSARRAAVARVADELEDNAATLQENRSSERLRFTSWREDHRALARWLSDYPELLAQIADTYFALERNAQGGSPPAPGRLYSDAATLRSTLG